MSKILNAYLFDEVNYQTVKDVIVDLHNAKEDVEIEKVVITLCSWGGYYYPAFALFDCMKSYPKEIEIIATGVCESSALLILQGATKRIATQNTIFLLHQTNHSLENRNISDVINESEQFKRENDKFVDLTLTKTKIDKTKFHELSLKSTYFTPQEALEMGFIDEVVS